MEQATVDYLKSRITSVETTKIGEIKTECKITFDNAAFIVGTSMRDINSFTSDEAQDAAYSNALGLLSPGVDFVLSKKD